MTTKTEITLEIEATKKLVEEIVMHYDLAVFIGMEAIGFENGSNPSEVVSVVLGADSARVMVCTFHDTVADLVLKKSVDGKTVTITYDDSGKTPSMLTELQAS